MIFRCALLGLALAGGTALAAESGPPRNPDTVRAIIAAAKEPNRDTRARVAEALGRMGKPDALEVLQQLAADPAPEVRAQALRAMRDILPPKTPVRVTLTVPGEPDALRLAALSAAARVLFAQRDALLDEAFRNGAPAERALAVEALALDAPARRRALLLPAAREGDAVSRAAALRALDDPKDAEAVALLRTALAERTAPNAFLVRAASAATLGRLKLSGPELRAAAGDEHFMVRREALTACAAASDSEARPVAQARATDSDYTVRRAACAAMGALPEKSSAPILALRLADEMTEVRDAAQKALLCLNAAESWNALMPHIEHKDTNARRRVWSVLGEYAQPPTADAALAHLKDADGWVAGNAVRILRVLGDRRLDEFIIATLKFELNRGAPPDPVVREAFRAAGEWKLMQPIPAAIFALKEFATPPRMIPPPFACSPELAVASIRYLVALEHRPAIGVMEAALPLLTNDAAYDELRERLQKLTGRTYPPAPLPPPQTGTYFIEVDPAK